MPLLAQTPCFSTPDTIGCLPHTVTLTDCSGAPAAYIFEENGIKDTTTTNSYTYTTGGAHSITQLINTSDGIQSLIKKNYIKTIDRPLPEFTLYACKDLEVLTKIDNNNYQKYIITYDDGSPNDTVLPFSTTTKVFLDNSLKTISVEGYYENFDCSNKNSKTVFPIISLEEPQLISLTSSKTEDEQTAVLSFSTNPLLEYYYEQKTPFSNYQIIDSIKPKTNFVDITFVNTLPLQYCYKASSFDRCNNNISSEEICSIQLSVKPVNNQNELTWNNYEFPDDLSEYTITKEEKLLASTSSNSFIDTLVECGTTYCYQTTATLDHINSTTGLSVTTISLTECVQATSTDIPPQINNLQSTFTNDSLSISWNEPTGAPVYEYHLKENVNKNGYQFKNDFITTDTTQQVLNLPKDVTNICYQLNYTDICGNVSPTSYETCPIILTIVTDKKNETHEASWTNYIGYIPSSYWLYMYDIDNKLIEKIDLGYFLNYTIDWPNDQDQQITFIISAAASLEESFSTSVRIEEATAVLVPNAFTPNEDNLNDTFKPIGRFIDSYTISVFNSMGIICFVSSDEQKEWSGKTNDKFVPEGTYYYEMTVTDKKGKKTTKTGAITVIY